MNTSEPARMDRRVAIKWMLTASAGVMLADLRSFGATPPPAAAAKGYGTDPDLTKPYRPGDYWPLTLTDDQRRTVAALADVILPADLLAERPSPKASDVGVVDFIDEWVSAPYPTNVKDRPVVLDGLDRLDAESKKRFGGSFASAGDAQKEALAEELSHRPAGHDDDKTPDFFKRFRDLVAAGYYTTPVGMKDIGYVGNVPLASFEGPPKDLIEKMGLADEVAW